MNMSGCWHPISWEEFKQAYRNDLCWINWWDKNAFKIAKKYGMPWFCGKGWMTKRMLTDEAFFKEIYEAGTDIMRN
ncbi:hypothetical protein AB6B39_00145 [Algimonas porphyrae]|uniref:Uncharacterized protein n=2 Tax=Algimonas porphyrae TaxID=1128113 RepID=A0ABQ5V210_9PROT|nr:hypothetical protein GCM10007854_19570 [Algimonas porphyrae]